MRYAVILENKNRTRFVKNIVAAVLFALALLLPAAVFAQTTPSTGDKAFNCDTFYKQFDIDASQLTHKPTPDVTGGNALTGVPKWCSVAQVSTLAINILFGLAGSAAVLFIVIGGFQYMTAAGNEEQAEKSRKIIVNSVIGLVVIVLAATMVRVVISALTGNISPTTASSSAQGSAAQPTAGGTTPNPSGQGGNPTGQGGGTGGTPGGTPASTPPTGGNANLPNLIYADTPPAVVSATAQNIGLSFNKSNAAAIAQACGVSDVSTVKATLVVLPATVVGSSAFSLNTPTQYSGSISLSKSSLGSATSGTLAVQVCGTVIGTPQDFTVANSTQPVNPGSVSDQDVINAANASVYDARWPNTDTLTIDMSGVLQQNINTICAKAIPGYENKVSVDLDGREVDAEPVSTKMLTLRGAKDGQPTVDVYICGHQISGNQPVRP